MGRAGHAAFFVGRPDGVDGAEVDAARVASVDADCLVEGSVPVAPGGVAVAVHDAAAEGEAAAVAAEQARFPTQDKSRFTGPKNHNVWLISNQVYWKLLLIKTIYLLPKMFV